MKRLKEQELNILYYGHGGVNLTTFKKLLAHIKECYQELDKTKEKENVKTRWI